ncbi:DUF1972 domain-containing protein [Arsenicitalea aurantiaca]|uniref:DUF1972 domain-containing protein n=1 Tax=Arsenicitalea aurantiaca TaxID=1783274 RepID=A0A433X7D3_9HYPH|nr:DUF1972 domain-containing protein [Arsenicitalea aurantiaca]RUT29965.1 DUF1972 domain-containing protein [Arsenicitalea aurantiaca]
MKLAILGTVGVPGRYGGFETLAENLVRYAERHSQAADGLTVYCSRRAYSDHPVTYHGARVRYSRLDANGAQSILYDAITALDAACRGHDRLLILGVSGAVVLPLLRLVSRAKIVINVDGIEWQRSKWTGVARHFLRWSEVLAVRYGHEVIADNQGIADYLQTAYGIAATVIAYGGDNALEGHLADAVTFLPKLPPEYALALCRIEPENNVEMILEAFNGSDRPLVFVGNWNRSHYGRQMRARYVDRPGLHLLDPIYDRDALYRLRRSAAVYVHGHSAGGTNPSLVEMMHFGVPILAHGCAFNRHSTEGKARYFNTLGELAALIRGLNPTGAAQLGADMREIAQRRYTWDQIGEAYFRLLNRI